MRGLVEGGPLVSWIDWHRTDIRCRGCSELTPHGLIVILPLPLGACAADTYLAPTSARGPGVVFIRPYHVQKLPGYSLSS